MAKSPSVGKHVYQLLNAFPNFEKYALCDQIRRAIVSVPSNVAAGCGRWSSKERCHFVEIAYGSLMEVYCQLTLAEDLGYVSQDTVNRIMPEFEEVAKMLSGFRKYLQTKN